MLHVSNKVSALSMEFTVTFAQNNGWFAVGVSDTGGMVGSDAFVCSLGGEGVNRYLLDSKSSGWLKHGKGINAVRHYR